MINTVLKKIFGSKADRDMKKMRPLIDQINALEEEYQKLSEEQLIGKTAEFRARLEKGETLDDMMVEAFATVKNACRRLCGTNVHVSGHDLTWDMVPFDVQLIGGITLHQGKIAEMMTGEGKTLVATLPVYLNALSGKGVHVVTTNDFLAGRDSEWMGHVYQYLGLTVGCLKGQMPPPLRREQYNCDITYGTNSEFGFDYLRDNMAMRPEDMVQQRGHNYAIIDEIDSILIDEARTPLIISGPAPYSADEQYRSLNGVVKRLALRQKELCTRLMSEAQELLESNDTDEAMLRLYQVHQGMPKNKQLAKLMEEPARRRLIEKVNNMMITDSYKEQARELREELFFTVDEKGHDANLTDKGCETLNPDDPEHFVMPDLATALSELDGKTGMAPEEKIVQRQKLQDEFAHRSERIHAVNQLIRAHCIYEKDVEYVVQENQVQIVDTFTGRLMPGRRWSDGLHQAIEAKEGVKIERETQTLATITIQNYFRMYDKLSGMTGTAETEASEFDEIYGLDVVVIPTNRPIRRVDINDQIYKTKREKYSALIDEIKKAHVRKQPVLVGTATVDTSEVISRLLDRQGIPHNVLNAKNHAREAEIVAQAGQPGAITIATNMAGRGTDIKLGEGVIWMNKEHIQSKEVGLETKIDGEPLKKLLLEKPCGLYVIASERHEARRIDRQLRGRCARQGDPGISRFYVSLEDDLMRLFGSDRIAGIMEKLGIEEGEVLEHPWLNKSIEKAQQRVEQMNFGIRKNTLRYDDVMNQQREVIYEFRQTVLRSETPRNELYDIITDIISENAEPAVDGSKEAVAEFVAWANTTFPIGLKTPDVPADADLDALIDLVFDRVKAAYELKITHEDPDRIKSIEQMIILQSVDEHWQEYLRNMDSLREGISLRAYGQRDPLVEYKREAFNLFGDLMDRIKEEIAQNIFRTGSSMEALENFWRSLNHMMVNNQAQQQATAMDAAKQASGQQPQGSPPPGMGAPPPRPAAGPMRADGSKVGRNDPCPCGSGKKYKKCCGIHG
ncbi:preprotein translocase subunit SecA [Tichowtungia aerotolerans]|uniref:Protein translocase subunit SecA n=1 Tax=Tichowtungia aerotolerans TaxID=2697043 RepID=A0A6P1M999_9BACT|nr:preprotein translocase subunit SecA [Tichowtungia aerotolerans]QHI68166.1 preprotein translocase subunit SecA [Tichowtungia aerotolerans]